MSVSYFVVTVRNKQTNISNHCTVKHLQSLKGSYPWSQRTSHPMLSPMLIAPAYEEAIGQHWGAAVHIPIAIPRNKRTQGRELTFKPAKMLSNINIRFVSINIPCM